MSSSTAHRPRSSSSGRSRNHASIWRAGPAGPVHTRCPPKQPAPVIQALCPFLSFSLSPTLSSRSGRSSLLRTGPPPHLARALAEADARRLADERIRGHAGGDERVEQPHLQWERVAPRRREHEPRPRSIAHERRAPFDARSEERRVVAVSGERVATLAAKFTHAMPEHNHSGDRAARSDCAARPS